MSEQERPPQDLEQLEPKDVVEFLKRNPVLLTDVSMSFLLGIAVGSLMAIGKTREYIHKEVDEVIDKSLESIENFTDMSKEERKVYGFTEK